MSKNYDNDDDNDDVDNVIGNDYDVKSKNDDSILKTFCSWNKTFKIVFGRVQGWNHVLQQVASKAVELNIMGVHSVMQSFN